MRALLPLAPCRCDADADEGLVAADAGSIYEPHPMLTYEFDPDKQTTHQRVPPESVNRARGQSYDLGPHPADPTSTVLPTANGTPHIGPNAQVQHARGREIWVYAGNGGCASPWPCHH